MLLSCYCLQGSWGKVIFSEASVILFTEGVPAPGGGGVLRGDACSCGGGGLLRGVPAPGGEGGAYLLLPATKLRQGYIFTGKCDSVNGEVPALRGDACSCGGGGCLLWGCLLPGGGVPTCYCLQRSWGKVIFSQASLILFTGGVPAPGGCLLLWGGGAYSRGCLLLWGAYSQGVPAPGGAYSQGAWWRPPRDGYCCGRYASYWNAFLCYNYISVLLQNYLFGVQSRVFL